MKETLLQIIREEPGILLSDLRKRFDPEQHHEFSYQLHLLTASGIVVWEECGQSHKLFTK